MIGVRTTHSAMLMVIAQLLSKSLDLLAVIVLARVLVPADFGLVALATSVMLIANSLTEIPVVEALIRNERLDQEDIHSAFTLTVLRGLVIAMIMFLIAQPLAILFDDERLRSILMVMALAPLIQGFSSPNVVYALKALNYGVVAKAQLIGKTASFVIMMVLAWFTQSYWALVAGLVTNPALTAIATHALAPYRPRLSTRRFGQILTFAGWVTLSRMVFTLNQQMDRFFVGAILGKTKLGFYSMAGDLSSLVTFMVATPITQPLFAAFSTMVEEPERLRSAYLRGQQILFTVVAPIGFLFAALAEPFVRLALGEKWLETVPLIHWLAPAIALQVLIIPTHALAMAMNRPKILVLRETASLLFRLPPTLAAAWWFGLAEAMAARSVAGTIMVFVMMLIAQPLIGATLWRQIANCSRSFVSILFMVGGTVVIDRLVPLPQNAVGQILELVGLMLSGVAIYTASLFGLWAAFGFRAGAESWVLEILRRKLFQS